jgi:hypothetical protein
MYQHLRRSQLPAQNPWAMTTLPSQDVSGGKSREYGGLFRISLTSIQLVERTVETSWQLRTTSDRSMYISTPAQLKRQSMLLTWAIHHMSRRLSSLLMTGTSFRLEVTIKQCLSGKTNTEQCQFQMKMMKSLWCTLKRK